MFEDPTFWVAVAFVITVGAIYRPVSRAVFKGLDGRAERIRQQLDEAQRLREEAQKTLAEYKRMQRDAVKESEQILANARTEAGHLRAQAERALEEQLARREKLAMEKIAQAEAAALKEVREQAVDLAIAATARLLKDKVDSAKADDLVERSIDELADKLH
ncbi:MAG: F0F1 ATP synthase subunit B [Kiloniellales bacterium]